MIKNTLLPSSRHQTIGVHDLPEGFRDEISDDVHFRQVVGELEAMVITHDDTKTIKMMLPAAMILAKVIGHESGRRDQKVTSIYWAVSTASVTGILDQVRTRMAQMLGELRAVTPAGAALPAPADASRAVSIPSGLEVDPILFASGESQALVSVPESVRTGSRGEHPARRECSQCPCSQQEGCRSFGGSARSERLDNSAVTIGGLVAD